MLKKRSVEGRTPCQGGSLTRIDRTKSLQESIDNELSGVLDFPSYRWSVTDCDYQPNIPCCSVDDVGSQLVHDRGQLQGQMESRANKLIRSTRPSYFCLA